MRAPKFTLFFTVLVALAFLAQDTIMAKNVAWLEFIQDTAFLLMGGVIAGMGISLREKNKKPQLINSEKLALEVAEDETKQLREKVKTLEAALERMMK